MKPPKSVLRLKDSPERVVRIIVLLIISLALTRTFLPARSLDTLGPVALLDATSTLSLLILFLSVAAGLGIEFLRRFPFPDLETLDQFVFGLPIGLGLFSLSFFTLGAIGLLQPATIAATILLFGLLSLPSWWKLWVGGLLAINKVPAAWRQASIYLRIGALLSLSLLALTILHALTPPWSYDALMYHLEAPRLFLEAGRLLFLPEIWQANGPLLTEMLFLPGLAFGSDTFARLIHATFGIWLSLAVYAYARRFTHPRTARLSLWILLGVPVLPIVAGFAYIDLAWALYTFLALYALARWHQNTEQRRWLTLAGILIGLAMSTKYLALGGLATCVCWILLHGNREKQPHTLASVARFTLTAMLIACPWYLKNMLLTGNPVFPFGIGGPEWPPDRLDMLLAHLGNIGRPENALDYILLPWNLYLHPKVYRTLGGEGLSLFFPLALFYFRRRKSTALDMLSFTAALLTVLWLATSVQIRFLLPIFPSLSVLSAVVLNDLIEVTNARARFAAALEALPLLPMLLSAITVLGILLTVKAPAVLLGQVSRRDFLERTVFDFRAHEYIQEKLPEEARVLMLWDGQTYYCESRCIPDADQTRWPILVSDNPDPEQIVERLKALGATHLLVSPGDAAHLIESDPSGRHESSYAYLMETFIPACTREVFRDEHMLLLELTCHGSARR